MIHLLADTNTQITNLTEVTRSDLASILIPTIFAFLLGLLIAPTIINFLTKKQIWRKQTILKAWGGQEASITKKLNQDDKRPVPRMGGLVIVIAVSLAILFFGFLSLLSDHEFVQQLNFISRQQTWLVIFSLVSGGLIGMLDDLAITDNLKFLPNRLKRYIGGGLSLKIRLLIAILIGCVCGWWFYFKLENTSLFIPFGSSWEVGIWIIPIIIFVVIATYSGGIIDGVDGLSGGVFASIFTVYAIISILQGNLELATFCLVLVGAIAAFLWHNIPPAKFYMSEIGVMALTITLSIVAFLTDTVLLLPIIALPLVLTSLSAILQVIWKKYFKRKLFVVAPLHNYFRARGHSDQNVVMRYWVISHIAVMAGLVIYLLGYPNSFLQ
ncbi:MAG: hypothetical protein OXF85_02465 [Candidatus Saccharibacteria bacterium]|nr:hypothetical protein [Candidatus Saccharibacteria bacterium]MCY4010612.1 hypothetical protein [Candidatus Saccharibacteria bacterium]MCY4089168.1 hypothetical protein [Candidatus Saccharibacteria bacterium]